VLAVTFHVYQQLHGHNSHDWIVNCQDGLQLSLVLDQRPVQVEILSLRRKDAQRSERRQPELVPSILFSEDAEEKAVHAEDDTTPQEYGDRLRAGVLDARDLEGERNRCEGKDTVHGSNNLRLQTKLVAEATRKVCHATLAVTGHIRSLPDMVEHMSTSEKQHGDQAECRPKVAVLQDRDNVGRSDGNERDGSENGGGYGDDLYPINRAGD
jgi:hypothetical protein